MYRFVITFAISPALGKDKLLDTARQTGLNQAAFSACVDARKYKDRVDQDAAQGQRLGVEGTPAFFVNGVNLTGAVPLADFEKMNQIRARVDDVVQDPATAEALKPWYRQFCKRPCFHDDYLQAFNRPNVQLVDTDGRGIDRITPTGVVVDDTEYEL